MIIVLAPSGSVRQAGKQLDTTPKTELDSLDSQRAYERLHQSYDYALFLLF